MTFEVRPASKGNPTVHVTVHGERLPAFRRKPTSSAEQQVRDLLKEYLPTHMEVEPEALQQDEAVPATDAVAAADAVPAVGPAATQQGSFQPAALQDDMSSRPALQQSIRELHAKYRCSFCRGLQCAECSMCNCKGLFQWQNAGVALCNHCHKPYCNTPCHRRGTCSCCDDGNADHQKHYDRGCFTDTGLTGFDCNAPLGLGCQCHCCKRLVPPLCVDCERSQAPCQECWGQWEFLNEIDSVAHSTSKYAQWREHWHSWMTSMGTG